MDIATIANNILKKFNTRNPFEIAKSMNVILVKYPLDGVRGFYHYFQRNDIIYINERLSEHEMKFVCSHELGHMLRHKTANAVFMDTRTQFTTQKYELEADRFAMNLLISDDDIKEHIDFTTSQLSKLFGYDKKLIELRLRDFV